MCIHTCAIAFVWNAQRDCAISFSWWGNTRSMPPPWMSNTWGWANPAALKPAFQRITRPRGPLMRRVAGPQAAGSGNPPPNCDGDALEADGRNDEAIGQHSGALGKFEQALRCKPNDPGLLKLAFMSACNAMNKGKARFYYHKLDPATAAKFAQMCYRNGMTEADLK